VAIGSLYNTKGVLVGQAAGFIAPPDTPLPGDSISLFDETVWLATTIQLGSPSAGTWTLTLSGGPFAAPVTISAIPFGVTASALQTSIQAVLPVGYTAIVSGTGAVATPFSVTITGADAKDILITGNGATLTGGTFLVTPSPWVAAGATDQGWQNNYNPTTQNIDIEEQQTPVDQQVTTAVFTFVANLAEDTIQSLQWALSATKSVQAPGPTNVFGKTTLSLQSTLPRYAVALETQNNYGMPRRYYVPRMTCAVNSGQTFRRAAAKRMVPVTFTSIVALSQIQVVEITANHT
jgi:hypothetical protein